MKKIQEINWGNFEAKFNGREQTSFEWLCYLLFCKEFDQNIGISGYKNHAGIETDPIEIKGEKIGWQAKFYDTRLSEHKNDFIESINTTKSKYKGIKKILFYTNQDFGQGKKGNDPQYKIEIDVHAKNKGIKIDWRNLNFFKSPFVCEENFIIAQHFFSLDKSIIDFFSELTLHTESILKPIHSKIEFNNYEIKIDRSQVVEKLRKITNTSSIIILSGVAGVGKTAVIKDFYDLEKNTKPFTIFKATEFNISNLNQLFNYFGNFTLTDFLNAYKDISSKLIVIDSAEKLSDIEYREVFQEFLSTLLDNKWKIIFTTRHSYLDDLKYQFVEVYKLNFRLLNIQNISDKELTSFAKTNKFNLPVNERLYDLIHNPFYLNEYLQNYKSLDDTINYTDFKNILWDKQISKSSYRKNNTHIKRQNCFIKLAQKRANDGHFFVKVSDCEDKILQQLESDEIIKYDSNSDGYFITHDIYEEWALDKIIERAFNVSEDSLNFYRNIGSSLPIRRAFRYWLSEKLLDEEDEVNFLIENTLTNNEVEKHWKDEVLIAVLLSDYSEIFFQIFEKKLLENNQELLIRVVFLLRIACKEIDEDFLKLLGISKTEGITLKTLFTKPKGKGWNCTIDFIHKHKEELGLNHVNKIVPLLDDWNNKNKQNETTKNASLMGLFYYDEYANSGVLSYSSLDETRNLIIRTILNGSFEIKTELTKIINDIVSNKEIGHRSKYYKLIQTILSSALDNFEIAKNLPEQVIRLADIFWFKIPDKADWRSGGRIGIEQSFCIAEYRLDYFPASAFQTPIFQLLRFAPKQTIDFILSFTNKTVECYVNSNIDGQIQEVNVHIDDTKIIKQYISNRLWNMYRGTQVSTYLLESIHMALEKWLLENAKLTSKEIISSWCKYLIENSKSASITAVVTCIVLAQPSKLFDISIILFQTKEFFLYDKSRIVLDYSALAPLGNGVHAQIMQNERLESNKLNHRKTTLEDLAVKYQFFRSEEESEQQSENRQEILWSIFDKYYEQLPDKSKETEFDKTWRLFLARMDRRKMNPTTEEKDGQLIVNLNPEIDPDLKKFSEKSLKISTDVMKFTPLKLWANYRFERNEEKYKQYQEYNNNPQLVITEIKKVIERSKKRKDDDFSIFDQSIPAYSCAVLIRDFFNELNTNEKNFCKEVIIEYALLPFRENYQYQISDGVDAAIYTLPFIFYLYPNDKDKIKTILFFILFNSNPIGMNQKLSDYSIKTILENLWNVNYEDAHSLFLGYLLLKPKYSNLFEIVRKENYKNDIYKVSFVEVLERFELKYEKELEQVISNNVTFDELSNINELDLDTLTTAFEILPLETENDEHKKYLNFIFPIFANRLFIDDDRIDYDIKHRFLKKFAYFILSSKKEEIEKCLKPFLDNFSNSRDFADFFRELVSAEVYLNQYEAFWIVWNTFYPKIVEICQNDSGFHYTKEIVHNYLLAWPYWREDAKEWHTLKDREKLFFKKVAEDIGNRPSVLYSISKLLNDIGSSFLEDGIVWLSDIFRKNQNLFSEKLEINTIYYLENVVRRYVLKNRYKVKKSIKIKNQVLLILNFLLEKGSVTGYLLREDIL